MRFSLRWFLAAIAFTGLIIATALRLGPWVPALMGAIVWGSLVWAAIISLCGGARNRPFATGYAVAGFAFLAMIVFPQEGNPLEPTKLILNWYVTGPLHKAITPALLSKHVGPGEVVTTVQGGFNIGGRTTYRPYLDFPNTEATVRLTVTVLLGLLSGCLATAFTKPSHV